MNDEKIKLLESCPAEASQLLRTDFKLFIKVFHWYLHKKKFTFKSFHNKIIKELESVVYDKPRNLVISIPPRFGKSAIMKYFVAWTYAINKQCNNIYTSYSDDLVRQFSGEIRDLINSPLYYKLFYIKIKEDTQNKGLWQIDGGGGVRACSLGGSITGFGAGSVDNRVYGGSILIDDALKADDARSETAKDACWVYYCETLLSRRNNENTPIIIIMQRLAVDDLVARLKKNNADFEYVEIPVMDENDESIWEERYSTEALRQLRKEQPGFFAAQYMQNPVVEGGNLFKEEMFIRGPVPSEFTYTFITCDTASTSKTTSDYTVAGFWGVSIEGEERRLYLLDLLRDKIDSAQCEDYLVPFIKKHAKQNFVGSLIEPKGHGIYLNQRMPMYGVPMRRQDDVDAFFKDRKFDKVMRANIIIPHLVNNAIICGPEVGDAMFDECKNELLAFPDGAHDDFCLDGDVLVSTVYGDKPIRDIKEGDWLITPLGISKVDTCKITGYKETISKFGLEATPEHKVFVGKSFDKLEDVLYDVLLDKLSYRGLIKWQYKKLLYLMGKNTVLWGRRSIICINAQRIVGGSVLKDFIVRCGSIIAERKYRKVMWFITRMVMCLIMNTAIWSVYQGKNILRGTLMNSKSVVKVRNIYGIWKKLGNMLKNGIKVMRERNGIKSTQNKLCLVKENCSNVKIAEGTLRSVLLEKKQINMERFCADGVMISIINEKEGEKKPVYNITTKAGCFYANGILVSNCDTLIDAVKFTYNREVSILDVL